PADRSEPPTPAVPVFALGVPTACLPVSLALVSRLPFGAQLAGDGHDSRAVACGSGPSPGPDRSMSPGPFNLVSIRSQPLIQVPWFTCWALRARACSSSTGRLLGQHRAGEPARRPGADPGSPDP